MATIAEIILPLPVKSNFHYIAKPDQALKIQVGKRVLVPFGKRKIYTGIIRAISNTPFSASEMDRMREIDEVLDIEPILNERQLSLFDWIAFYYFCTPGEVFKAALPLGLKPESSLKIRLKEPNWHHLTMSDAEFLLMEALEIQTEIDFQTAADIWEIANPRPRLIQMESKGWIELVKWVEETYKPKFKTFLTLTEAYQSRDQLEEAFELVSRSAHQENLLMTVAAAFYKGKSVPKTETLKSLDITSAVSKALVKKGILNEEQVQVDRMDLHGYEPASQDLILTPEQQRAFGEIQGYLSEPSKKPILLHGITGSGKTHLYMSCMKPIIEAGRQILYLLPEITLTKQIIDRIRSVFGDKVGIYHSRFNDHERVEIWQKVRKGEYQIVIGVRSAIFLPFPNLGMIVVDEEHDHSFKQYEPAPRYQARDVATYMGRHFDIPVILGSATPSMETYTNALEGKYHLVELHKRAIAAKLPDIQVVDMRMQRQKRLTKGMFSQPLEQAIRETLERKEQVILFQNRRGYSPYLLCETCGYVPQCIHCDISMTYHKEKGHLRCHYCGYTDFNVQKCSNCSNYTLRRAGIGTERIVESVQEYFPEYVVERMDWDTTRTKHGYANLIQRFENRQIDILVGTQMVSKGLDFEHVTLVGVILADNLINFPDFRAHEQAYQLITQVSGRAGRSTKRGRVIIQTMMPDSPILTHIERPFKDFYQLQLAERAQFAYPPHARMIRVEIKHKDRTFIEAEAMRLYNIMHPSFGANLLGPDYALVPRVRNQYRMQFLLKIGKEISPKKLRTHLEELIDRYFQQAPKKTLRIVVDIDPA
ncbi:primosomal protein N' [Pontibacter sp. G13]|uniref:replication restart helicase PriA n=1 Tax=Pontibacter sp. G13 TaxID=3074898 RepID=UPI00288A0790|nr:primosomal protein N' [Pontibacter sp. G13]WNJ19203.1 primosomal protein N' [Pontibacter sp. G13]